MARRVFKANKDSRAAVVVEDDAIHLRVGKNFVSITEKGIVESGKKASLQGEDNTTHGGLTKGRMDLMNLLPSFGPAMPLNQRDINIPIMPLLSLVETVGWVMAIGIVMSAAMGAAK